MPWSFTPSARLESRFEALFETLERAMAIPGHPGNRRPEAITRLDMVNVLDWLGRRDRHRPRAPGPPRPGTRLLARAWVNNVAFAKDVWADTYLLDGAGEVLYAQTFALDYLEPAGGMGDCFTLDVRVPASGLGSRAGEARRLQFRLYYRVEGELFTDGLVHDHELVPPQPGGEGRAPSRRRSLLISSLLLSQAAARRRRRF